MLAYGAVGPVGAHPVDRSGEPPATATVGAAGLADALADLHSAAADVVIEIDDDGVHELDLAAVAGTQSELGGLTLRLARSLTIRAADARRPTVRLAQPLRARALDAERAAVARAPARGPARHPRGGLDRRRPADRARRPRQPRARGLHARPRRRLRAVRGEGPRPRPSRDPAARRRRAAHREPAAGAPAADRDRAAADRPRLPARRHRVDRRRRQRRRRGSGDGPARGDAARRSRPAAVWGPELAVERATFLGRVRVERASGFGGIWAQPLEVLDDQTGCIKHSWFSGRGDRLPQTHACVRGAGDDPAPLRFVSEAFGRPEYGQLALDGRLPRARAGARRRPDGRVRLPARRRTSGATSRSATASSSRWGFVPS